MRKYLLAALACLAMASLRAQAPNTISGLQLWLDASDPNGTGTVPANGSAISNWVDKSGNGRNAVAITGGGTVLPVLQTSAIGTAATISFNRTAAAVAGYTVPGLDVRAGVTPDVSIFTVYRQGSTAGLGQQALWGIDNGGWDRFFFSRLNGNDGAVSRGSTVSPYTVDIPGAGTAGLVRLVTTVYDGNVSGGVNNGVANGSEVYLDGQLLATSTDYTHPTDAQTSFRIGYDGDDNFYQGEIAEVIVFNRKLTGCELQTVNRYLSDKYGQNYKYPTVTASGPTSFCAGGSVTLSSSMTDGNSWQSSPNGITWTSVAGETNRTFTPTSSGYYRVRICGNEASSAVQVTVTTQPTAAIAYSGAPFCPTGTATPTLTGTGGGAYSSTAGLSLNASTGAIDLAASTPGLYTVTYTIAAAGGCNQTQASVLIGIHTQADVTQPANATACAGAGTTLATFAGTGTSYTWTNNNTATGLAASGSGNIPSFTATNGSNAPITSTITVTPTGSGLSGYAYVPNVSSNTVSVINLATNAPVTTLVVGSSPFGVTVLPDRSRAFVSSVGGNNVAVINTSSNTVIGNSAYNQPHGLAPSPDGTRVYVNGYGGGGALSWIDMNSASYVSTFMGAVPNPEGMAVTPDGSKVVVASSTAPGKVYIFNTTAPYASTQVTVGDYPQGVAINPNGRYAYVAVTNSNAVSVIDLSTNAVVNTVTVGTAPLGVAISPDGTKVYVTNAASNNVSVISTASNTVTATITAGNYPYGVSVTPDGSKVYVTNRLSNNLTVISTAGNTTSTVGIAGGNGPIGLGNMLAASYQCNGTPKTFTFTVNPKPSWNNGGFSTSICNNQGIGLSISNGGTVPGADYSWTNSNPAIGTPATGSGNGLGFTGTNSGTTNIAAIFTVTPSYTNNGVTCAGDPNSFTITVKPSPTVNTPGNQALCAGSSTAAVTFSGTLAGTTYDWTNSNTSIGLAASGSGNIASFTAANAGGIAQTATITVTPTANGCPGTSRSFTITVNPQPTADISYNGSPFCATGTATPTLTGTAGGTYASTSGLSINSTTGLIDLAASTAGTYTVSYTIPPGNGCGTVTANTSVTIQSAATISQPGDQTVCGGSNASAVTFSGTNGSGFTWTNNTPAIGLAASGTGNIPVFTAMNNSGANVTATITVNMSASAGFCPPAPKTFTITVTPQPTASFSYAGSPYCSGTGTATPTFTGTSGGTYSAASGLSINATTGAVDIAASTPGTHTVTYTIPASGVCPQVTSTASISINPPVTATITASGPTTICPGGSVTLSAPATPGASYLWSNGATTGSITVSAAGTFTVAVTSNGCAANGGPVTVSVNPAPTVNAIASQNLCNGAPATAVTFSGAVPGTVYSWTNNSASIGLAASGSGDIASFPAVNNGTAPVTALINVTPTYTNGGSSCPGTPASFSITVNPTPTVNNIASQVLCNGATSANVAFSGAFANTAFSWVNNNTSIGLAAAGSGDIAPFAALNNGNAPVTATITVTPQATLSGRAYVPNNSSGTVSMIDLATGAVVGSPITVGANPFGVAVLPDRSKVYVSNTGGNSVSVINTTTNTVTGTSPYNAPHGLVASPDGTRVYVNGWTDNAVSWINAASNVSTFMTNVTQPEGMAVSADGARLYVASSTSPGSLVVINTASNNVVSNVSVGNFPQGVALSADGSKVYVVNNGSASVSVISTANNSVVATIPVGANPLGVAVSPDGSKLYITNSGNNNVSVINTATNALTASIAVGSFPYGVAVSPDGSTVYVANRNSNNVSVINAATNAVSNVAVGTAPIALGQFTTASLQCAGTPKTFTISVNPTPTVSAVANRTACAGTTVAAIDFSGQVTGTVYTWTNSNPSIGIPAGGSGSISAFTATNSTSTVQTATITVTPSYTNGGQTCTGNPTTFTITVQPTPTVTAIPSQTVCNGAATTAVAFTGPVAGISFNWSNNTPSIGLPASGTGVIPSFVATNSTASPVTATITVNPVANACPGTAQTYTITVNPTPTVGAVTSQSLCAGASSNAVAFSSTVPGSTFTWTNNTPSVGLAATGSGAIGAFTTVNAGTAPVVATVTVTPSANGCSGSPLTFTYTVNPLPAGTITAPNGTLICPGTTVPLQVTGGTSYQWLLGGTPIAGATNSSYNATLAGTYTVNVTNAQGCTRAASNSISITLGQKPTASFSFNSYCLNAPVTFTNSTGTTGAGTVGYQWNFGNGSTSTQASPTAVYNSVGTYTVQLIASPNGCPSLNDTVTKTIGIEAPLPGQRLATIDVVANRPTEIHARNLPNAHYSWTPTTGLSNPALWYPVATLSQEQEYRIQMSFNSGCTTVDTLLVRVQKGDDIFVPTAFSPDGDGVNDVLRPITVGLSTFRSFHIYDRMGRELFATNQINQGWNGTLRGTPLPAETYIWVVEGRDSNGQIIRKTGQVVLVR